MDKSFARRVRRLHSLLEQLLNSEPVTLAQIPTRPRLRGVYLLSKRETHLYVGRSDHIRRRLQMHGREKSGHNQSSFAFRMANKKFYELPEKAGQRLTRQERQDDELFGKLFDTAKKEVREMDFRYVIEEDSVGQALLEIYCAEVLQTEYNSFHNH